MATDPRLQDERRKPGLLRELAAAIKRGQSREAVCLTYGVSDATIDEAERDAKGDRTAWPDEPWSLHPDDSGRSSVGGY